MFQLAITAVASGGLRWAGKTERDREREREIDRQTDRQTDIERRGHKDIDR